MWSDLARGTPGDTMIVKLVDAMGNVVQTYVVEGEITVETPEHGDSPFDAFNPEPQKLPAPPRVIVMRAVSWEPQ